MVRCYTISVTFAKWRGEICYKIVSLHSSPLQSLSDKTPVADQRKFIIERIVKGQTIRECQINFKKASERSVSKTG